METVPQVTDKHQSVKNTNKTTIATRFRDVNLNGIMCGMRLSRNKMSRTAS